MCRELLALQRLLPEATNMFKIRYMILQNILKRKIVGRRTLVSELGLSERLVRTEIERLEKQGLIVVSGKGMSITKEGQEILSELYRWYHSIEELNCLETQVESKLELKKAIIIKGSLKEGSKLESIGLAFSNLLSSLLEEDMTLAITGGSTIAQMIDEMPYMSTSFKNLHVLPARGSVGERVEYHANTLAIKFAHKIDANYEMLTIPDNLSTRSIQFIKSEPEIEKILQRLSKTDIIIFGIGNALKMAKHRKESQEVLDLLESKHAVSESFRHYFNVKGEVVYHTEVIGVSPTMAKSIKYRIAVAGGEDKANAILASKMLLKDSYLILDEGAAQQIIHSDN